METNNLKELIIQKKESYQSIIDETKKANVNKTLVTGVSLAALVAGVSGVIIPATAFGFAASLVATGFGAYGTFMNIPSYVKNLYIRCKSKLAQRKLNKALKFIDSLEETPKTKTIKK